MTKIGNLLTILILFFTLAVSAETLTEVKATLDRDQMALGDAFTLSVTIASNEDFDAVPKLPTLKGIEVINSWADGKSQSVNMSFINGKASYEKKQKRRNVKTKKSVNKSLPQRTVVGTDAYTYPVQHNANTKAKETCRKRRLQIEEDGKNNSAC